jgi:hypothetical protein
MAIRCAGCVAMTHASIHANSTYESDGAKASHNLFPVNNLSAPGQPSRKILMRLRYTNEERILMEIELFG